MDDPIQTFVTDQCRDKPRHTQTNKHRIMTTMHRPRSSALDCGGVSSLAVAEILRIRRSRQSQHEHTAKAIEEPKKSSKKSRPRLTKAMSERRMPSSLSLHLSGGGGGGGGRHASLQRNKAIEEEEDNKSMSSMGSMSSCGSNWTIGSTNSMDENKRRAGLANNRRAKSERLLLCPDSSEEGEE